MKCAVRKLARSGFRVFEKLNFGREAYAQTSLMVALMFISIQRRSPCRRPNYTEDNPRFHALGLSGGKLCRSHPPHCASQQLRKRTTETSFSAIGLSWTSFILPFQATALPILKRTFGSYSTPRKGPFQVSHCPSGSTGVARLLRAGELGCDKAFPFATLSQ